MTIIKQNLLVDNEQVEIEFVNTKLGLESFLSDFTKATIRSADTETFGWQNGGEPQLRVLSCAAKVDNILKAWVIDARDLVELKDTLVKLQGLVVCGWNASYDEKVLDRKCATKTNIVWWDAMLSDAVCHQGKIGFDFYRGLAKVALEKCGITLEGKGTVQVSYDALTDLTESQIQYAALDAIATLKVSEKLQEELKSSDLVNACQLEQRARPFLNAMELKGMPIDWDGWKKELQVMTTELDASLGTLALLTGGGPIDIFTMCEQPSWKPNSPKDVKDVLNKYAKDLVESYFKEKEGTARLLSKLDKADKDTLKSIGGEIAEALLSYRSKVKILSTYGENLAKHIGEDGRMHPQYLQVIGTDTGRLSSRNPNAQNFTPRLKPYFRPKTEDRIFCYADLSQAELRFLAQVSGDENMRDSFVKGQDIHVATAERMFGVDMNDLEKSEPKMYKIHRSKAKMLNFGIVYGLGPTALASNLTLAGVETSMGEAKILLAAYLESYPGVKSWLRDRDAFVRSLAKNPPQVDFSATMKLHELYGKVKSVSTRFKKSMGKMASVAEIQELIWSTTSIRQELENGVKDSPVDTQAVIEKIAEYQKLVEWVNSFTAPVVLDTAGKSIGFSSYTKIGRQRRFQILTESFLLDICIIVCQSKKSGAQRQRDSFATRNGIGLSKAGKYLSRDELNKIFENRALRREFVEEIIASNSQDAGRWLVQKACGNRIEILSNAYRNAPIQGGVADVVLDAYGILWDNIVTMDSVWPVQTVHDSIVVECDKERAEEVAGILKKSLEDAMKKLCPDVPAVADADIRSSLDDGSVIKTL